MKLYKSIILWSQIILIFLSFSGCSDFGTNPRDEMPQDSLISFRKDLRPIFQANCDICHGNSGGLIIKTYDDLMRGNSDHGPVVIPGDGSESIIIRKLKGEATFGDRMPKPPAPRLSTSKVNLIEMWIDQGAENN